MYKARYEGTCSKCGKKIERGHSISWTRTKGAPKATYHADCNNVFGAEVPYIPTGPIQPSYPVPEDKPFPGFDKPIELDDDGSGVTYEDLKAEHDRLYPPKPKEEPMKPQTDVEGALQILLGAINQPKKAEIDRDEVRKICEDIVSEKGTITLKIEKKDTPEIEVPNAHKLLSTLIRYAAKGRHVYVYGAPGGGKSYSFAQVAKALNRPYYYISLTPQTPKSELFGYMDAHGKYVRTAFREAYEHGGIFGIEEADNGGGNLQTALNTAFENGHCSFPDGLITRHADFTVLAGGNTSGRGASPQFPDRRPFDQAFAKRFTYLHWTYDEKLERQVALAINPNAGVWVSWMHKIRRWAEESRAVLVASPRETFRIVEDLRDGFDVETVLNGALWNGNTELRDKALSNFPLPV